MAKNFPSLRKFKINPLTELKFNAARQAYSSFLPDEFNSNDVEISFLIAVCDISFRTLEDITFWKMTMTTAITDALHKCAKLKTLDFYISNLFLSSADKDAILVAIGQLPALEEADFICERYVRQNEHIHEQLLSINPKLATPTKKGQWTRYL